MSRVVPEEISLPNEVTKMDVSRAAACASPTLGQLLKYGGDVRKEVTGDETPVLQVIDVSSTIEPPAASFPSFFQPPHLQLSGETLSSGTRTILGDISGKACDGEIVAVMGASGSRKSTLINALAHRMALHPNCPSFSQTLGTLSLTVRIGLSSPWI
ncbi:ABC transporter G family member 1 [Sesamum alatum]|uniref:ABC transporter G family member 1 n=1 Tax=Sesamum alatum TaxID=300844 RepID=A0AAE2CK71_9LAMI|nr:ABC transporter G family member 1 [Sesamum alatum]